MIITSMDIFIASVGLAVMFVSGMVALWASQPIKTRVPVIR